jgi:hypothetical protein
MNGYNKCGNRCAPSDDITACGASCRLCPQPPQFGTEICSGGNCDFTCDGSHRKCGTSCVDSNNDKNNCGTCNNRCDTANAGALCAQGICEILNFTRNLCSAQWIGGGNGNYPVLLCPSTMGDTNGWYLVTNNPTLSDGQQYAGPALAMHPYAANDGVLSGAYPAIRVESGYRLQARVGCSANAFGCSLRYQVTYQPVGGSLGLVIEGTVANAGAVANLDVSLAPYVGQDVQFNLAVIIEGGAHDSGDTVFWVNPRIVRP